MSKEVDTNGPTESMQVFQNQESNLSSELKTMKLQSCYAKKQSIIIRHQVNHPELLLLPT